MKKTYGLIYVPKKSKSSHGPNMCEFELPMKIQSEMNKMGHWAHAYQRKKKQQRWVKYIMPDIKFEGPYVVTLERFASRFFDDDNLRAAFKYVRDAVADKLIPGLAPGRADDKIEWKYKQVKVKRDEAKIKVTIESRV